MEKKSSAVELDQNLSLLEQNFFKELEKIAAQRLKLEKESISSSKKLSISKIFRRDPILKPIAKSFTVRLESSLGEKLAKSRGTADELEDKLQETRLAFEDKLLAIGRMKKELDRRENLLILSIQEIEKYLRAVFYLKQEADDMHVHLMDAKKEHENTLEDLLKNYIIMKQKKEYVLKIIYAFQPAKSSLENMMPDFSRFPDIKHMVEYFLVLKELQKDLLDQEAECAKAEEELALDKLQIAEYKKRIPLMVVSKESNVWKLKSKLRNMRTEIAQLEDEMDITIAQRIKDDRAWYDIQRWIKKIFKSSTEIKPPGPEEPTAGIVNMLDRIKDFVVDAMEMVERLKKEDNA